MELIVKVTSPGLQLPLSDLLRSPLGLDVWEVKPDHLILRAAEAQIDRLARMGYGMEQLQDVAAHLSTFATDEAIAGYHSAAGLEQDLRRLAEARPDIAEIKEIGRSIEDRAIPRAAHRRAPRWGCAQGPLHGLPPCARVDRGGGALPARQGAGGAGGRAADRWLVVQGGDLGRTDGQSGRPRAQPRRATTLRKNRRSNPDGSFGVDPNRNYGYMWGILNVPTSSHVPSDETYVGPRAFSEPETRAVRDLIACDRFSGVITYHSYSQLILYPWGYTEKPISDNHDRELMVQLAGDMQALIGDVHGVVYTPQQSSELYPTAGDTTDWTYGIYGIPSFTIELRPRTHQEGGFILPASQIQPTWRKTVRRPSGSSSSSLRRRSDEHPTLNLRAARRPTSVSELGDAENISKTYLIRILHLALLAPRHRRGNPRGDGRSGAGAGEAGAAAPGKLGGAAAIDRSF